MRCTASSPCHDRTGGIRLPGRCSNEVREADAVQAASAAASRRIIVISRAFACCVSFLEGRARRIGGSSTNVAPLSGLPGVTISSIGTSSLNSLGSGERPGDFCVGGTREIVAGRQALARLFELQACLASGAADGEET
jgi:hypothetical protein